MWTCCYYCFKDKVILIPVKIPKRDPDTGLRTDEHEEHLICFKCLNEWSD